MTSALLASSRHPIWAFIITSNKEKSINKTICTKCTVSDDLGGYLNNTNAINAFVVETLIHFGRYGTRVFLRLPETAARDVLTCPPPHRLNVIIALSAQNYTHEWFIYIII